jgi:hypothetical protein
LNRGNSSFLRQLFLAFIDKNKGIEVLRHQKYNFYGKLANFQPAMFNYFTAGSYTCIPALSPTSSQCSPRFPYGRPLSAEQGLLVIP